MKKLPDIVLFSRVSFLDKLLFAKHLAIMLKSGVTLAESLETLLAQTKSPAFKAVLNAVLRDIKNGQQLGAALKKHPNVFDYFYISLVDIGEESGTLEENLSFLANQLAKDYAMRKKIVGALLYPAIILATVTVLGLGLSIFVFPKLIDLFSSFNIELPLSTKILLFTAGVLKNYWFLLLVGLTAIGFFLSLIVHHPKVKPSWHRLLLNLPIFGSLIQNEQLAALFRDIGVMLKSGLTIKQALAVQEKVTSNLVFKAYIQDLQKSVEKGKAVEEELLTGHFSKISPIAVRMIGVGEKTGKLDEIFLYLGDFFEEEVDNAAKNLSVVLEPVLLLVIGLIVGFVAISIITPIYQFTGSIRR